MKNTKRILALILAVLMMLASSACASKPQPNTKKEKTTGAQKETEKIPERAETSDVIPETEVETTVSETEQGLTTEQTENTNVQTETTKVEEPANKYEIYSISDYCRDMAVISTSAGCGYINSNGKVIIEPIYDEAYGFEYFDGSYIALVKKNGKYGYIDRDGKIVIDYKYNSAETEIKRISRVSLNGTSFYIDVTNGDIAYTVTGKEVAIGEYSNGYIWVQTKEELISGTKFYLEYYDMNGECVGKIENGQPCIYYGFDYSAVNKWKNAFFYDDSGLSALSLKDGYIWTYRRLGNADGNGSMEISELTPIYHNYFVYEYGWNGADFYYIDYQTMTIKPSALYFSVFSWVDLGNNYYYSVRGDQYDSSYNVILHKDKVLIDLDKINDFSSAEIQGVAYMKYNNKNYFAIHLKSVSNVDFYSLIDDKGNVAIKPTMEYCFMYSYKELIGISYFNRSGVYSFDSGYCKAQDSKTGLWGCIDINGKWIIKPKYDKVSDFVKINSNIIAVANDKSVIGIQGKVLFDLSSID